jgi:hypothetical protein
MLDSPFLEALVCMVFVYGILSALASLIQEVQAQYLDIRPHFLVAAIRRMLSDDLIHKQEPSIKAETWDFIKRGFKIFFFPATFPMMRIWIKAQALLESIGLDNSQGGATPTALANHSSKQESGISRGLKAVFSEPTVEPIRKDLRADYKLVDEFFQSSMIKYMGANDTKKPSYISRETFTTTLVDICRLKKYPDSEQDLAKIEFGPILPVSVKSVLEAFIREAYRTTCHEKDANCRQAAMDKRYRDQIAHWYEETMHRATGWFKRDAGKWLFWWGLAIAIFLNADTFRLYRHFLRDADARGIIKSQAIQFNNRSAEEKSSFLIAPDSVQTPMDSLQARLARHWNGEVKAMQSSNSFGWRFPKVELKPSAPNSASWKTSILNFFIGLPSKLRIILFALPGLLATALAISFGAPFWFDLLSSVVKLGGTNASVRMSGVKPESKKA